MHNLGSFYTHVYAGIYGGEVAPLFKEVHDVLPNGELRNFHPDIVRRTPHGDVDVEVKYISLRDNRPSMAMEQLENYLYCFSRNLLEARQKNPDF